MSEERGEYDVTVHPEPVGEWRELETAEVIAAADWYSSLVSDCHAIVTEAVFVSRWALVEGYWQLGQRIVTDGHYRRWEQGKAGAVLQDLAKDIGQSERTLYYAIQFYAKYPRLETVPEGKNITWSKLVGKYLPKPGGEPAENGGLDVADLATLKHIFNRWFPEGSPRYARAYELVAELSALIVEEAGAKS